MSNSGSAGFNGLELRALTRRVGSHTLVDQLSLQVAPGEILALLGPSGCGKSSTLRLIVSPPQRGAQPQPGHGVAGHGPGGDPA